MQAIFDLPGAVARGVADAVTTSLFGAPLVKPPALMPTPRDTIRRDGPASLYRFRRPEGAPAAPRRPVLLVPSMINRWYVLDLRAGASLVEALTRAGHDVWCLDWGVPRDEDRDLRWDEVIDRLSRMARAVRRETGADAIGVLGYCMGATLSSIFAALEPSRVAALVNLAGPIDFTRSGLLGHLVDPRWFDVDAIAEAGNVAPTQMQSGFTALRPTLNLSKLVGVIDRGGDAKAMESFNAMEAWGNDNIPFPAAAYRTYISELYQQNLLVKGEHRVKGRRVDLGAIDCPVLVIGSERDTICPLPAARALIERSSATDTTVLAVPGGHVGAVVGSRASRELYPATAKWLRERLDR
ncbi:MAG: alpha/beta fold hydrolase [Polyangiales bacterium]